MHKNILAHLNESILLFNRQLELIYINAAGEILLADSAKHLLGLTANSLFKSSASSLLIDLQQCLNVEDPIIDREIKLVRLNHTRKVNISVTPLFHNNYLNEILVEMQQVDRQLRISKEKQLFAQQNMSRLLAKGLAHEIKNPLGGIRGAAQLLELELKDQDLQEYTQIIIQESDRLKALMDKMLGPKKPAKKELLNIHEVLERVKQLVNIEADKIIIKTDYDPSIPDLKADKNQLIQVVLNIVQNAVQAMQHKGTISIKSRVLRQLTIGRKHYKLTAKIDISDSGPGITSEMMSQIFYPMITSRAEGTGLGLSIAQSLINQHNGFIECESEPGNTIFSIFLPLVNADEKE
ncbi:MAG: nitrogen regulation protein NR(II) [Methylococcales symbiont of Iophon sp. n. MRB-2018]|nr:MAG: nitrogen regulation protein NR(II) [Methylococcales symbiont of Iophon sp. n. MRB-2018]KAF3979478.1 MAG: nitrogen regulation protein NR(II) [Methylococcales symbiont of Iophon sp. n. MRB-2018]